jgi:hypothetical protein
MRGVNPVCKGFLSESKRRVLETVLRSPLRRRNRVGRAVVASKVLGKAQATSQSSLYPNCRDRGSNAGR